MTGVTLLDSLRNACGRVRAVENAGDVTIDREREFAFTSVDITLALEAFTTRVENS